MHAVPHRAAARHASGESNRGVRGYPTGRSPNPPVLPVPQRRPPRPATATPCVRRRTLWRYLCASSLAPAGAAPHCSPSAPIAVLATSASTAALSVHWPRRCSVSVCALILFVLAAASSAGILSSVKVVQFAFASSALPMSARKPAPWFSNARRTRHLQQWALPLLVSPCLLLVRAYVCP